MNAALVALAAAKAYAHPAAPDRLITEAAKQIARRVTNKVLDEEGLLGVVNEELERLQILPTHQQRSLTNLSGRG